MGWIGACWGPGPQSRAPGQGHRIQNGHLSPRHDQLVEIGRALVGRTAPSKCRALGVRRLALLSATPAPLLDPPGPASESKVPSQDSPRVVPSDSASPGLGGPLARPATRAPPPTARSRVAVDSTSLKAPPRLGVRGGSWGALGGDQGGGPVGPGRVVGESWGALAGSWGVVEGAWRPIPPNSPTSFRGPGGVSRGPGVPGAWRRVRSRALRLFVPCSVL